MEREEEEEGDDDDGRWLVQDPGPMGSHPSRLSCVQARGGVAVS